MWLKLYERTISSGQTYTINHIPPLILQGAHVKLVKHTVLVVVDYWTYLFVSTTLTETSPVIITIYVCVESWLIVLAQ